MSSPDPATKAAATIGKTLKDQEPTVAIAALAESVRKFSTTLSPSDALRFCRAMNSAIKKRSDEVSAAILASVNGVPGKYPGFTIIDQAGRASVDTALMAEKYPDAFAECVTWGSPYKTVALTRNQNMPDNPINAAADSAATGDTPKFGMSTGDES